MSKPNKNKQRDVYDIKKLMECVNKNAINMEPDIYTADKMAVFGANINLKRHILEIDDGLKPVSRRMLLTMHEHKLYNQYSKSAQVVGDMIKKYHPHGDSAAYAAIVFLGQPWRNNISLVDTDTNFGSAYDPDGFAHYRYTKCGMSKFAYDCFFKDWRPTNYKEDMAVDWIPTYDESGLEPVYLPARYPLFILNWHKAIGLGASTMTPGFNLKEALDAVITLMNDPDAKITLYPDDPRGCTIVNKHDLHDIMDKNGVRIKVRANYRVVSYGGKEVIEIDSVPFEVKPITVKNAIQKLAEKGELPEISDIDGYSISLGNDFRLSIELKKGYDADAVMSKLYRRTSLEETFVTKYSFVNGLQSIDCTLRISILEWVRHRIQTLKRIYKIRQVTILKRMHFLEPLIKVIESGEIDEFIKIVRHNDTAKAILLISKKFNLTDYQAEKIVDVKISDLSRTKLADHKKELAELTIEEREIAEITNSKKRIKQIIISQLREGIEKYGTPRKSKVMQLIDSTVIPDTFHYLIFTTRYVKKLPYDDKGWKIGRIDNGEKVVKIMYVNNRERLAIFTEDGRCLPICVNDIGNSSIQSIGISYTQLGAKDNTFVNALRVVEDFDSYEEKNEPTSIVAVTSSGLVMKTSWSDIIDKTKPFAFMRLDKNDKMTAVKDISPSSNILAFTDMGMAIMFPYKDFETTAINTKGVLAMKLDDGDKVIGVSNVKSSDEHIVILTDRGYMKRLRVSNLPITRRNGKPIEINSGNGTICSVIALDDTLPPIYIGTTAGPYLIDPMNIKNKTRLTKAERIIELKASDYVFGTV